MSNKNYQIAVIDPDGQIIKVYPQEQYNQHIIEQYRKGLGHTSNVELEKPIYSEPSSISSEQNKTVIEKPNSVSEALEASVKPFHKLSYSIAFVFVMMAIALAFVAFKVERRKRKAALALIQLVGVILITLVFLNFLKSL